MTVELIYKTTTPQAVEWWLTTHATLEDERIKRNALANRLGKEFGPSRSGKHRELWINTDWGGGIYITGMSPVGDEWRNPPEGWRFDRGKGHLVPALRTARGKKLAAEFEAVRGRPWRDDTLKALGVPPHISSHAFDDLGRGRLYNAGYEFDGLTQTLYQTWGSVSVEKELLEARAAAPNIVWEKVKKSEWYALQEAKDSSNRPGE